MEEGGVALRKGEEEIMICLITSKKSVNKLCMLTFDSIDLWNSGLMDFLTHGTLDSWNS